MGLEFFAELNATNRAHCAAHGFSSSELYGTAPNAAEYETALIASLTRLNNMGPLKGMSGHTAPRAAPAPHAVVEYARPDRTAYEALAGESIQQFYAACRRRTIAPCFTGD